MSNKKLLGGLVLGIMAIGGLAWSTARAANSQPATQPTPVQEQKTCGCGNAGCQANQNKANKAGGCGCQNKANYVDNNNNGICDRAEQK